MIRERHGEQEQQYVLANITMHEYLTNRNEWVPPNKWQLSLSC